MLSGSLLIMRINCASVCALSFLRCSSAAQFTKLAHTHTHTKATQSITPLCYCWSSWTSHLHLPNFDLSSSPTLLAFRFKWRHLLVKKPCWRWSSSATAGKRKCCVLWCLLLSYLPLFPLLTHHFIICFIVYAHRTQRWEELADEPVC